MAKMVKLTDEVGSLLEERAQQDGTTIAGEIKLLLDGKDNSSLDRRLDKMARWLEKRFDDLEAAMTLSSLSSLSSASSTYKAARRAQKVELPWPLVQDIMFEVATDEWLPGREAAARSSDMLCDGTFFTDGEVLYSDDAYGKQDWLKVSPKIQKYIDENLAQNV